MGSDLKTWWTTKKTKTPVYPWRKKETDPLYLCSTMNPSQNYSFTKKQYVNDFSGKDLKSKSTHTTVEELKCIYYLVCSLRRRQVYTTTRWSFQFPVGVYVTSSSSFFTGIICTWYLAWWPKRIWVLVFFNSIIFSHYYYTEYS